MTGIAQLDALAEALDDLATVPSRAANAGAQRINALIADQFSGGHDPYGEAWADLEESTIKRKGGDARILIRSGALADQTRALPARGAGIEITTLSYGAFHQLGFRVGTAKVPARPILPYGDELPEAWERAIDEEIDRAFERVRRGR